MSHPQSFYVHTCPFTGISQLQAAGTTDAALSGVSLNTSHFFLSLLISMCQELAIPGCVLVLHCDSS
jgi:hypothetical protein